MGKIQISSKGIEKTLRKFDYLQAISEYIWNGFDAQATVVDVKLHLNVLGGVDYIVISDNGYGIDRRELERKFTPFFESEKQIDPEKRTRTTSAMHGKNGIGRLTFHRFASDATWKTTYTDGLLKNTYTIQIGANHLDDYKVSSIKLTDGEPGTSVTFHNIVQDFILEHLSAYLCKEFGWFLELHADKDFDLRLDGQSLDYSSLIGEKECFDLVHAGSQTAFQVKFIRWQDRINHEYSKLYFIDSHMEEKYKQPTTFNNKGDSFYHSVYIQSKLFDYFDFESDDQSGQLEAAFGVSKKSDAFQFLLEEINAFIKQKRKPYLEILSDHVIQEFAEAKAFPDFTDGPEDTMKKNELESVIRELCQLEPRVFARLNLEQKKLMAHLIHLAMGSAERKRLLEAL
ncbi:ATP-binding protein [Paenibacillus sp. CGMCC 1.16610]|uniref:ATP-binding protein n=1 Tax=Paenibacillus TaxID=44249 RepID=UPI0012F7BF85|nr:ATP-binding protein [Paenibacillus sp. CGMCC 1.16610]MBA2938425.1 ATP-binding protein [Paenibacillus sp. CGMCC 1.16610]